MKKYLIILTLVSIVVITLAVKIIFNSTKSQESQTHFFEHPAIENPEVAGKRVVDRIELLEPKEAFNFNLIDMNNSPTSLKDFRGKLVLIGFIYTNCPDVCGILTLHFRRIQKEFKDVIDKDLTLILITTDPQRDTPERIAYYTKGYEGRWHFLTGTESQLKETWDNYRVFVKTKQDSDLVYHSYMVVLIDRQGLIRYRYVGLVDPEEIITKDINYLLKERRG
ncbi:MAG: SCO family protein [Acidobacteriota bacterium]